MPGPPAAPAAVAALAPTGTLRAAINLSNFLLVSRVDAGGVPEGVSPDMAQELAMSLGVDLELLTFESPGALADAATSGVWDIGNIGAEPARAEHIAFTSAYCEIEATFLVAAGLAVASVEEVDRPGNRIAVKERAAYALWLERNLQHAELVTVSSHDEVVDVFVEQDLDAIGGLRPRLLKDVTGLSGASVLDGRFTAVQQAIGTPRGRDPAGFEYLTAFVERAKASGLVARLIENHGVVGLSVPG